MDPQKAASETHKPPQGLAESAQTPSGALLRTPGHALGSPKAAYELSKDALKPA